MDSSQLAVSMSVGLIVGVMLVSGPLVPIDFTGHLRDPYCEGTGNASVTVESVPTEEFALARNKEKESYYAIEGPPVKLLTEDVQGCPIVTLDLSIPQLGFESTSKTYLSPEGEARVSVNVVGGRIDPERIENGSYPASIELRLTGNETRTLYQENTTVEVMP